MDNLIAKYATYSIQVLSKSFKCSPSVNGV
nr:MAG TPA: hypothetical protein [Caudoviricetes sp.]